MDPNPASLRLLLGLKLRALRQKRGLSLKDLAEKTGLSISYLSEIESGHKYPKLEKLVHLAAVFGVPYDELVSAKVGEELGPLRELLGSAFFQEFPFALFGIEPEAVIDLLADAPVEAGALLRAVIEIGLTYNVRVEHFLFAALRSYQQLHSNYFPAIEDAVDLFLSQRGWLGRRALGSDELQDVLETELGWVIDESAIGQSPALVDLRSVTIEGSPTRLLLNGKLLPAQRAFQLGREIGYLRLGLKQRSTTSVHLAVESFEQVINDFKAAYFSGALLIQRQPLLEDLTTFFSRRRWSAADFLEVMLGFHTTPETFFYRLSQVLPAHFGVRTLFFVRFGQRQGAVPLTKILNMSPLPIPIGIEPQEHYCRRWPGQEVLRNARLESGPSGWRIELQRSTFADSGEEYLVLSLARGLALAPGTAASVSLGIRLDDGVRGHIAFCDDPQIPRREVNLTCERCSFSNCRERAAPPTLFEVDARQRERSAALDRLFDRQ